MSVGHHGVNVGGPAGGARLRLVRSTVNSNRAVWSRLCPYGGRALLAICNSSSSSFPLLLLSLLAKFL